MRNTYFIIYNSDGETRVNVLTKEELTKRLNEEYYGDDVEFLGKIDENDTNYWGDAILIINGEIITPKPVEAFKGYEL